MLIPPFLGGPWVAIAVTALTIPIWLQELPLLDRWARRAAIWATARIGRARRF